MQTPRRPSEGFDALKRRIQGFDWKKLGRIDAICLDFQDPERGVELLIATCHWQHDGEAPVILKFSGVRELRFPDPVPTSFSFGELNVQHIGDRQLERLSFLAKDHLTEFSFYCSQIQQLEEWPRPHVIENDS